MKLTRRLVVPSLVFLVLVATALVDGYFRDEFYYLACSRHMAWGYVDQPPLSVAILWAVRHIGGESLLTLRVAAALAAAGAVFMTGSLARTLGAGAFGEILAMTGMAVAPAFLAIGSFYSMNVFDVLLWTAAARAFAAVITKPATAGWILLGFLLGLGLLNKISVLWLGAGIAAALVLTPARRTLKTPGPWIAAVIAGAMFLPHVLWQIQNGWPTLEFIRNAGRDKMQVTNPASFLLEQVLNMHPFTLPIWVGGLAALFAGRRLREYRALGIVFLVVLAILLVNRTSRSVYLLAAFPMLMAAGSTWWEQRLTGRGARTAVLMLLLLIGGAITLPLAVPILPVDAYVRYSRALGLAPASEEKHDLGRLPQFFADRQHWPLFVAQIGAAWDRLTPSEREHAAVLTGNYGEAGAIERLGRSRGMRAISGHNNYWLWGPDGATGDVLIVLSRDPSAWARQFDSLEQVGETDCGDCMPYENHLPILIGRRLHSPLPDLWPRLKHYE
jgi:4-amino-4-deoxy-L-arabinose transferase-like glycosyltransferase